MSLLTAVEKQNEDASLLHDFREITQFKLPKGSISSNLVETTDWIIAKENDPSDIRSQIIKVWD